MNNCTTCDKPFKHYRWYNKGYTDESRTCKEVTIVTACARCRGLLKSIKKKHEELLDLEYAFFSLTNNLGIK